VKFCYNFTKHLAIKMNPFELALGVEMKQFMDLTLPKTRGIRCEGSKEVEEMGREESTCHQAFKKGTS
jgi:hypothetical protein